MIEKVRSKIKHAAPCDFWMLILVTMLAVFSVIMVFSASYYKSLNESGSPYSYLKKQIFFVGVGFLLMYAASYIDYHFWRRWSILILGLSFALLLAVLAIGSTANGAQRWIAVGPLTIMPGEIAKPAMILFTAAYFAADMKRARRFTGLLFIAAVTAMAAGLIVLQPNLSTAITICLIVLGMALLAGMSWKILIALIGVGAGGFVFIASLGNYMSRRILSFTDPFKDPSGDGFQAVQSLLALGTGGLFGLGLGKSVQKNLYLPEPQNDFILAIIGEELGFVGVLLLLIVFLLLVWRGFRAAMDAPDNFGMLLAGGITLMIGIQVVLNVAVVTSSMPPTGIALPFISYGGNATWIFMGSAGIMLNISRQGMHPQEEKPERKHTPRQLSERRKQRSRRISGGRV